MTIVVDASVAAKWFLPEELNAQAIQLLDQPSLLHAPDFIVLEVANILWKKCLRGELTIRLAEEAVETIRAEVPFFHSSSDLTHRALQIGAQISHAIYDCLYLACAEIEQGVVVTADDRFCRKVEGTAYAPMLRHLRDFRAS